MSDYHFKQGFNPKCPQCGKEDIRVSLSEHLHGPCNGPYEIIYCANDGCHTFLGAHPIVTSNLFKNLPEDLEITYENE